jgi:hypothetical protein
MAAAASTIPVLVEVPATVVGEAPELLAHRLSRLLVFDEVRQGRLSRVAGARLLGLSLDEFLRVAGAHGVLTLDYDPDDFEQEIESIRATAGRA